jgi:Domain of unknown function (DUF1707)
VAHNSQVTDDATDGRPWPIDPGGSEPDPGAVQVPDLAGLDDLSRVLSEFAASTNRSASRNAGGGAGPVGAGPGPVAGGAGPVAGAARAGPTVEALGEVTDEDRNRFGTLLDHAAERGLLSVSEYEVRLGELADATTIDQMQQIVTELPVFTPAAAVLPPRSRRSAPVTGLGDPGTGLAAVGSRRRPNPWVIFATLLLVVVALLVFFVIYAQHLIHTHDAGALSAALRVPLSGLRL